MSERPTELRLATDIAAQFREQSPQDAAPFIAQHIRRNWDPRMRASLIDQVHARGSSVDLHVAAVVDLLE